MSFNLAAILETSAAADPERPLAYVDDATVTFGEVDDDARRVATGLLGLGLRPGDRVVVQLPNIPEFLSAYFGILKAGLVMVPLNPLLAGPEIAYQVVDSGARAIITHESTADTVRAAIAKSEGIELLVVGSGDAHDFIQLLRSEPVVSSHATLADDTAVVLYTSGTTGRPKGAELTHFQLYMNCTVVGELYGMGSEDVMTAVLPLFHVFGLSNVLNVAVRYGVPLALVRRFDAEDVLDAVERHRITIFSGVPTMFIALLRAGSSGRDLRSLRRGISGGASMPVEVIHGLEATFPGLVVLEGYGLSETASCSAFNIDFVQRKVASIGRPIWGIEMRIVDSEDQELGTGPDELGEIVIRGHNIMKGYLGRPDATAEAIRDGWFHSGDLGYVDTDGYFYVVDRLKDLIIRGGYNVYPREIEEVLHAHPDVIEVAVVGRPDDRLGEEVTAYVVLQAGSTYGVDDLDRHCRTQLAAYKYPREFVLVAELPKGATGKILKRELRADLAPTGSPAGDR